MYVLMIYSLRNEIRINDKGYYTSPVGKRDFSSSMQKKTSRFIERLQEGRYEFLDEAYVELEGIPQRSIFYLNKQNAMRNVEDKEEKEQEILKYLDEIHVKGYKFVLMTEKESRQIKEWLERNKGKKTSSILNAEADKELRIINKEAYKEEQGEMAKGLVMMNETTPTQQTIALKSLEIMEKLAEGLADIRRLKTEVEE